MLAERPGKYGQAKTAKGEEASAGVVRGCSATDEGDSVAMILPSHPTVDSLLHRRAGLQCSVGSGFHLTDPPAVAPRTSAALRLYSRCLPTFYVKNFLSNNFRETQSGINVCVAVWFASCTICWPQWKSIRWFVALGQVKLDWLRSLALASRFVGTEWRSCHWTWQIQCGETKLKQRRKERFSPQRLQASPFPSPSAD